MAAEPVPKAAPKPTGAARACPVCGKPTAERFRPFCSGRCADVDLHRWFQGTYAIAAEEPPEDAESAGLSDAEPPADRGDPGR